MITAPVLARAAALAVPLFVASCSAAQPEVAACEGYIKATLKSPATYRRASVLKVDVPTTPEQFIEQAGDRYDHPTLRSNLALAAADGLAIRSVRIEYDVSNDFGVPIRDSKVCGFKLVDGKLDDDLHFSDSQRAIVEPDELTGRPREGAFPCCL